MNINELLDKHSYFVVCSCYLFVVLIPEISRDISWSDDVATTCPMFLNSISHDHEVLFNKEKLSVVKSDSLLSVDYLTLAKLAKLSLLILRKCFEFHRYNPCALQI